MGPMTNCILNCIVYSSTVNLALLQDQSFIQHDTVLYCTVTVQCILPEKYSVVTSLLPRVQVVCPDFITPAVGNKKLCMLQIAYTSQGPQPVQLSWCCGLPALADIMHCVTLCVNLDSPLSMPTCSTPQNLIS